MSPLGKAEAGATPSLDDIVETSTSVGITSSSESSCILLRCNLANFLTKNEGHATVCVWLGNIATPSTTGGSGTVPIVPTPHAALTGAKVHLTYTLYTVHYTLYTVHYTHYTQYTIGIHHYAGLVMYDPVLFLIKNKDSLHHDVLAVCSLAQNPLVKKLFLMDEEMTPLTSDSGESEKLPSILLSQDTPKSPSRKDAKMTKVTS